MTHRSVGSRSCEIRPMLTLPTDVKNVLLSWGLAAATLSQGVRSTIWMKQGMLRRDNRSSGPPTVVVSKKELRRRAENSSWGHLELVATYSLNSYSMQDTLWLTCVSQVESHKIGYAWYISSMNQNSVTLKGLKFLQGDIGGCGVWLGWLKFSSFHCLPCLPWVGAGIILSMWLGIRISQSNLGPQHQSHPVKSPVFVT